jgi:hypothetical protein
VGSQDNMKVGMYSFDCRDAAALAEFWSGVLMRPVDEGATSAFATIGSKGMARRGCSTSPRVSLRPETTG